MRKRISTKLVWYIFMCGFLLGIGVDRVITKAYDKGSFQVAFKKEYDCSNINWGFRRGSIQECIETSKTMKGEAWEIVSACSEMVNGNVCEVIYKPYVNQRKNRIFPGTYREPMLCEKAEMEEQKEACDEYVKSKKNPGQ